MADAPHQPVKPRADVPADEQTSELTLPTAPGVGGSHYRTAAGGTPRNRHVLSRNGEHAYEDCPDLVCADSRDSGSPSDRAIERRRGLTEEGLRAGTAIRKATL
jgi:hypothetical protein